MNFFKFVCSIVKTLLPQPFCSRSTLAQAIAVQTCEQSVIMAQSTQTAAFPNFPPELRSKIVDYIPSSGWWMWQPKREWCQKSFDQEAGWEWVEGWVWYNLTDFEGCWSVLWEWNEEELTWEEKWVWYTRSEWEEYWNWNEEDQTPTFSILMGCFLGISLMFCGVSRFLCTQNRRATIVFDY